VRVQRVTFSPILCFKRKLSFSNHLSTFRPVCTDKKAFLIFFGSTEETWRHLDTDLNQFWGYVIRNLNFCSFIATLVMLWTLKFRNKNCFYNSSVLSTSCFKSVTPPVRCQITFNLNFKVFYSTVLTAGIIVCNIFCLVCYTIAESIIGS